MDVSKYQFEDNEIQYLANFRANPNHPVATDTFI
jgi:hypothetical protein